MRTTVALTTIVLALLVSARADAREWELSGGSALHVLRSPSVDAATSSDVVALGDLGAAVEIWRGVPILDRLSAELRWQIGSTSALDFGRFDASLELQNLHLGLRGARDVYPHLRVFLHADLGGTRGRFTVSDPGSSSSLSDVDWTMSAYAGAGVDVALVERADRAFGLRLELGFMTAGDLSFAARPGAASGAPLETRAAPLGDLDAGGAVIRIHLFGRW